MIHLGTKELQTARLVLRPFTMQDTQAMFRNWASDDEVTRHLTWPTHRDETVTKIVLAGWVEGYAQPNFYQWAIVLKELDEPIGGISVVKSDDTVGMAHVGYCLGRAWWHQGIMTEALQAVIDFLFDEVGMQRIESMHDVRNPHSGAVMRKCGMKFEGTHRRSAVSNQGLCDTDWYAILSDER